MELLISSEKIELFINLKVLYTRDMYIIYILATHSMK